MYDLEYNLQKFKRETKELENKDFSNFEKLETAYCKVINLGTEIRNYIVNNPQVCDENSLKVLTNQTTDMSLLDNKYKCLSSIITLTQQLLQHYQKYALELVKKEDFKYAARIYEQMFKFSHNYNYKLEIANINFRFLENPVNCYYIYKEIEPYMQDNTRFLWGMSDVYGHFGNYFRQVLYIQKAVKAELKKLESERIS